MAPVSSALEISKIGPEHAPLLRNLYEHYIHDMSEWLHMDTGADGSYSYDTAALWRQGYEIYLGKIGDSIAGFAITCGAAEWSGTAGAHDVHEFFVLRKFRRSGVGRRLAEHIWNEHPESGWVVRVLAVNRPAIPFWQDIVAAYTHGAYTEEQRTVKDRDWRFFRFGGA